MPCEHDVEIFFNKMIGQDFRVCISVCKNIPNVCWSWWWNCRGTNSSRKRLQGWGDLNFQLGSRWGCTKYWSLWFSYCQILWCSDNISVLLYLIIVFFFFPMWLELFCERVQVSCIVEKNTCISSHFCHFSCSFWRHQSLGFEFFALGFLRRLFPRRLSSVKFRMFFLSFFIIWWIMFNRRIE